MIPVRLVFATAVAEANARAALHAAILATLNAPETLPMGGEAVFITNACHEWMKGQINSPESASFFDERVRVHPNGSIVAAGRVESDNLFGGRCTNWYFAAIDPTTGTAQGDLVDFNPVTADMSEPLRVRAGDALSYQDPRLIPRPSQFWLYFWILIGIVALAVILGWIRGSSVLATQELRRCTEMVLDIGRVPKTGEKC